MSHLAVFSFEIVAVWKLSFTKLMLSNHGGKFHFGLPNFYFYLPKIKIYLPWEIGLFPSPSLLVECLKVVILILRLILGRCCVELHHASVFGDAIAAFLGHYEVGQETGSKFAPKNSPTVQFDATLNQSYAQPQNYPGQEL